MGRENAIYKGSRRESVGDRDKMTVQQREKLRGRMAD
jgi:hypothetical protein